MMISDDKLAYTERQKIRDKNSLLTQLSISYDTFSYGFQNYETKIKNSFEIELTQLDTIICRINDNIKNERPILDGVKPTSNFTISNTNLIYMFNELGLDMLMDRIYIINNMFAGIIPCSTSDLIEIFESSARTYTRTSYFLSEINGFIKNIINKTDIRNELNEFIYGYLSEYIFSIEFLSDECELVNDTEKIDNTRERVLNSIISIYGSETEAINLEFKIPKWFLEKYIDFIHPNYLLPLYSSVSDELRNKIRDSIILDIESLIAQRLNRLSQEELSILNIEVSLDCTSYALFKEVEVESLNTIALNDVKTDYLTMPMTKGGFTQSKVFNQPSIKIIPKLEEDS